MFKLTPEAQARASERQAWLKDQNDRFSSLSNENLVAAAAFYMQQMKPVEFPPGDPVYDAVMWHVILPELMKRVGNHEA